MPATASSVRLLLIPPLPGAEPPCGTAQGVVRQVADGGGAPGQSNGVAGAGREVGARVEHPAVTAALAHRCPDGPAVVLVSQPERGPVDGPRRLAELHDRVGV